MLTVHLKLIQVNKSKTITYNIIIVYNFFLKEGAIRFMVKTNPVQLITDYNVAPCGDDICEEGETCSACSGKI